MGKGDKKSKKGKISRGSSGVKRQKKSNETQVDVISSKKTSKKKEVKETVAKKPAAKKEASTKVVGKKDEPKKPLSIQLIFQAPDLPTPKVNPRSGKLAEEETSEAATATCSSALSSTPSARALSAR
jgi:ribosomal small subunit protein bTHX